MTLDEALETALYIEAVRSIEEDDNKSRVSALHSNKNNQLVNSIKDLRRILQTNQPNQQDNQKFSSQGASREEFLKVSSIQEKPEIESPDYRRTNYESRTRSPIPGCKNRSRDGWHKSKYLC